MVATSRINSACGTSHRLSVSSKHSSHWLFFHRRTPPTPNGKQQSSKGVKLTTGSITLSRYLLRLRHTGFNQEARRQKAGGRVNERRRTNSDPFRRGRLPHRCARPRSRCADLIARQTVRPNKPRLERIRDLSKHLSLCGNLGNTSKQLSYWSAGGGEPLTKGQAV